MIPNKAEVVIIGGGSMGICTAYYLAEKGCTNIIVIENQKELGGHTTSRCAGAYRHQFSTPVNIELSKWSIAEFQRFKECFGYNYEMDSCGYMFLLSEDDNIESFKESVEIQNKMGIKTEWLTEKSIRQMIPMVSTEGIVASTYYPKDGLLDPSSVVNAYISEARNMGVEFFAGVNVIGIDTEHEKVSGIITSEGKISTRTVVIAAGPWSAQIGKMVNIDIPITPVPQQLTYISDIPWDTKDFPVTIFVNEGLGLHKEGKGLLTGLTKAAPEKTEYDFNKLSVDDDWELINCEKVINRVPSLENSLIQSSWIGFYETTPDSHPILGKIPDVEGLYCSAGFNGHGFMHSPVCGHLISEEILHGKSVTLDIDTLRIDRFRKHKTNKSEKFKI
ncbi:FAD-dependent oxidoreductase [Anaerocolumna cellulosilytica]|uniref:FAD-dependent oxidoreductase n=1 Tax=Anaerocolumna cellulosilytica TaxID=433286 RepID=A0A6S6R753_9FIRM|nr:FAD-binding oxidoreductase [Anaerocolumna cellulosilytica]MBB5193945.1 sarcosine oxidase subunit beta [Anaerocolumna cellulosilytica]BCJ94841.1 FAD-dependent oxidoreductase [Anaerocolumna cellulosilytica]